MRSLRRTVVALVSMVVLLAVEAILDPTGLLALAGWSGAAPRWTDLWTFAPYLVFIPVLLGMTWWVALRAGDRFWTLAVGVVLALLLAQAAMCFVMTWDLAIAAWASSYVTAKAVPAALIVAAAARWRGGPVSRGTRERGAVILPALLFGGVAPLVSGLWWTSVVYAPAVPVARPDSGILSALLAMTLLAGTTFACLRWMRPRVPGVLGGWLAAVVAGGLVGVVQALVVLIADGVRGDLWPLMATYVAVADGLSFGACVGWVAGVAAVVIDRIRSAAALRVVAAAVASVAVIAGGVTVVAPVVPDASASSASDEMPGGMLRTQDERIVDGDGDQVLLRGVNVNQLVDFYRPDPAVEATRPLTDADFAGMAAHGFNVVRLGISWSALEPVRGSFDGSYVARIVEAVDAAERHGLFVVLDMHQDSWWN